MPHALRSSVVKTRSSVRSSRASHPFLKRVMARGRAAIKWGILVCFLVWGSAVFIAGDGHNKSVAQAKETFFSMSREHGFAVADVLVEGRQNLDRDWLLGRVSSLKGRSVFEVDIDDIQRAIENQNWVEHAQVQRVLPNKIKIIVKERVPYILLDEGGKRPALMDKNLVRIGYFMRRDLPFVPLVEGKGAPAAAQEFIALLKAEEVLKKRVKKSVFVGERRWDLLLDNGVRIKLPEEDVGFALRRLMKADEMQGLLAKDIRGIDLRQSDRIIIETRPGQVKEFRASSEGDNI